MYSRYKTYCQAKIRFFFSESEPDVEIECCQFNTFMYEKYNPSTHICEESGLIKIEQITVCINDFCHF